MARWVLGGFAGAMLATAIPASAEVITIGDDGAVVRQDGPAVYLTPDLKPTPIGRPISVPLTGRSTDTGVTIRQAAERRSISPSLITAVAWHESRFNQAAVSPKGARGIMQLMPATARALGVDPNDSAANVLGGTTYLGRLMARYDGDIVKALAAYNAGPGAVDRWHGVPPFAETRAYVAAILDRLADQAQRGGMW